MKPDNKYEDIPIFELLQKIKNKIVDPSNLHRETRQACVEILCFEGYQQSFIASLLKTSDRTIRRDIVEIRKKNSLEASGDLTKILIGEMVAIARTAHMRLKQIARMGNSTPRTMSDAEYLSWTVIKEMTEKLYLFGFLTKVVDTPIKPWGVIDTSNMSEKDKAITEIYSLLPPQEREKLLERLQREITKLEKEDKKAEGEEPKKDPDASEPLSKEEGPEINPIA